MLTATFSFLTFLKIKVVFASGYSSDHCEFSKIVENDLVFISHSTLSSHGSISQAPNDLDGLFV